MSTPESLFRREALEHHERPGGPGGLLALHARWVTILYWATLGLFVIGVGVAVLVRVEERVSGPAVIDPTATRFVALLPGGAADDVAGGNAVRLHRPGAAEPITSGYVTSSETVTAADAQRAGFPSAAHGGLLVHGTVPAGSEKGGETTASLDAARAEVVVGSGRLLEVVFR